MLKISLNKITHNRDNPGLLPALAYNRYAIFQQCTAVSSKESHEIKLKMTKLFALAVLLVVSVHLATCKVVDLNEVNWDLLLKGEWMVEL